MTLSAKIDRKLREVRDILPAHAGTLELFDASLKEVVALAQTAELVITAGMSPPQQGKVFVYHENYADAITIDIEVPFSGTMLKVKEQIPAYHIYKSFDANSVAMYAGKAAAQKVAEAVVKALMPEIVKSVGKFFGGEVAGFDTTKLNHLAPYKL